MFTITEPEKVSSQQEEGVAAAQEGVPSAANKPTTQGAGTENPKEASGVKQSIKEQEPGLFGDLFGDEIQEDDSGDEGFEKGLAEIKKPLELEGGHFSKAQKKKPRTEPESRKESDSESGSESDTSGGSRSSRDSEIEALQNQNQGLKERLEASERKVSSQSKRIGHLQEAAAAQEKEKQKKGPSLALQAEKEKSKVLAADKERQKGTIAGQDKRLKSLSRDLRGAEEQVRVFGQERDAARAAEGVQAEKSAGLGEEFSKERAGKGLSTRERSELELRKRKGGIDELFISGVQKLLGTRHKGIEGLRKERKREREEEVSNSGAEEAVQGPGIKVGEEVLRGDKPVEVKEPGIYRLEVRGKETVKEPGPEAKRVRFRVPVEAPEPSNIGGKFGRPGLKKAPDKV
ncbi:hypothetical protein KFL_002030080 [Klebsormidium nitens]|uniref:Uncharacterized protein n=1 Tax=Klebsormidium nitens TaxID=105231 RepID=A0A1Y1I1E3_KLENI|nr:hypothetical protein KFL_002030080 [Klebsormidium nitens]|eukprot:GAQ84725.1 hypothetical protein KFL_002030080 [Klebsormidium nitens]